MGKTFATSKCRFELSRGFTYIFDGVLIILIFSVGKHGFPLRSGKVQNLDQFDAQFFNIPENEADLMDPMLRKLLEVSYEALIDAGNYLYSIINQKC